MPENPILNELLERACPSIKYHIRLEILDQPRSAPQMLDLQSQIQDDPAVKEVFSWQQPDGWLAWDFHGYQSIEAGQSGAFYQTAVAYLLPEVGAYTGLMLEPDWRDPQRRINDLTFRSLLILHYSEGCAQPGI